MPAPDIVYDLVDRFERNLDTYRSPQYKEAHVRQEFLNPFFAALGWDVNNAQGWAEAYKEVVHEAAIRIEGAPQAPDYSFRIGGVRTFFVEAKKPLVNVREGTGPAYQLRRYAWSANLPLSILTDFEEWATYDCRLKPSPSDKASTARVQYLTFRDYVDRWDEISSIFSKEAILYGSFDKFADSNRRKRGTAEVDDEFLQEIETWRELLAKNIALRNRLSTRELNHAVQMTIDRIVFLRICEDRGIEDYGQLREAAKGKGVYERLLTIFWHADHKYNSGLFHFEAEPGRPEEPDALTRELQVDDKPLREILGGLYYPESPYEFRVLPAEILGQVYERFLGKTIRLTGATRAVIEEKPEVRKAGGVYYTPAHIVDYIVERTVGPLVDGKTPEQVEKLKILDPACGSGSFLLGAYQFLLDWHLRWYLSNADRRKKKFADRLREGVGGEWRLTTGERKRILLNNLFGVDIDTQAVEVTKLSLLLKVLEGETEETLGQQLALIHERALPDLGNNIKTGNSLVGFDLYADQQYALMDDDLQTEVNAFEWEAEFSAVMRRGGFDAVIGNPPYDVLEKDRGKASWPHAVLRDYIRLRPDYADALGGKLNLFRFFIVRSLSLTRRGGRFGMIVPLALLGDISCRSTRQYLMTKTRELTADCFPQKDDIKRRVFRDAKLSTVIITGERADRAARSSDVHVRVYPANKIEEDARQATVRLADSMLLDPDNTPIPLLDGPEWDLCVRVHSARNVTRLGDVADVKVRRGEVNQKVYEHYITNDSSNARLLKGMEVAQFRLQEKLSQGEREWFDEELFAQHGKTRWAEVSLRRIATQRITGVDERLRIVATIIDPPCYFADSTNSLHLVDGSPYNLEYLLALLNSHLFQWRFKLTSTNNNVGTNELEALPFRVIDFTLAAEKQLHDSLTAASREIGRLHSLIKGARSSTDATTLRRRLAARETHLNAMVYDLYGLNADEIALVESSMNRRGLHARATVSAG